MAGFIEAGTRACPLNKFDVPLLHFMIFDMLSEDVFQ